MSFYVELAGASGDNTVDISRDAEFTMAQISASAGKAQQPKCRFLDCRDQTDWLETALADLRELGFFIVTGVLDAAFLEETRAKLYSVQSAIEAEVGAERLKAANELGVLRLMMKYEPFFFKFLEIPELLQIVDATVLPSAVMHLQNGFILPSQAVVQKVPQNTFHMDFKRVLNGYMASLNVFFAIDEFTETNGATLVVPYSHQKLEGPKVEYMESHAVPVLCPAGSMMVFDSTLWHAAGRNESGQDRLAINHQFTSSFIKPQMDYIRGLGVETIAQLPERTQQLLGMYTRSPATLAEYYVPAEKRMYRGGQW